MAKKYYMGRFSLSMQREVLSMQSRIKKVFNIDISQYQASKIIAWKSRNSNIILDDRKLLQILGGKDE